MFKISIQSDLVERILRVLLRLERKFDMDAMEIKAKLDAAFEKVSAIASVQDSVNAGFAALQASQTDLKAQIVAKQAEIDAEPNEPVDLTPLGDSVDAIIVKLDDVAAKQAVLTNTPADPNAPPVEEVPPTPEEPAPV